MNGATVSRDKLFNFRPIFFSAVFFALGIGFACLHIFNGVSLAWCFLLLATATPVFFRKGKRERLVALLCAVWLALVFALGFVGLRAQLSAYRDCGAYQGDAVVSGRVVELQVYQDRAFLTLDRVRVDGVAEKGRLIAYLPATYAEKLSLAQFITARGYLRTDTSAALETDSLWEVGRNVRFSLSVTEVAVENRPFHLFLFVRERVRDTLYAGMNDDTAAVALALLTGETSGIDAGLLQNIRYGGIAHVFAVSGLHVGVLYGFCLLLLKKKPLRSANKIVRFVLPCAILLLYGGVCGFSASVIRAVTTCLVLHASMLWFMGSDALERIGLAALIVLAITPTALFEVGFQLSFIACLGILAFAKRFSAWFDRIWVKIAERGLTDEDRKDRPPTAWKRVYDAGTGVFCVTFSAQLATAPVLLQAFGYLSGWSLVLNLLLVPIISGAFVFLLGVVVVACALPLVCAPYILYVPNVCLAGLLLCFEVFDFSAFSLTGVTLTLPALVAYYGVLVLATDKWNIKKSLRIFLCVAFAVAFGVTVYALNA